MRSGLASAGELTEIFSAPQLKTCSASVYRADPAGDAEGDVEQLRHPAYPGAIHGTILRTGGDVIEHQLIGALVAIAGRQFENITHHAMILEAHAFDDLPVANIQAGDYAFGKNGRSSSGVMRSSRSALPLMAAAAPSAASA